MTATARGDSPRSQRFLPLLDMSPDPAPNPEAGVGTFATSRGNLPLQAVDIGAAIHGTTALVEVTQRFQNPHDIPLEATYIFPLPDRAAVTAMRMEGKDRVVDAVLKERAQARQDYDDAVARGRQVAIAEEERPDVFTMRVGNIEAGEEVTARLTLAQPLAYDDGELTFRFPLVVGPRYIPAGPSLDRREEGQGEGLLDGPPVGTGTSPDTAAVPDASRITPPVLLPGFPNPVRLALTIDVDPAGLPIEMIRSSLHAIAERSRGDGHTIITLQPGERLDRDFILRLGLADTDQEDVLASATMTADAETAGEGTFVLTLFPTPILRGGQSHPRVPAAETRWPPDVDGGFAAARQVRPRDVVLVLDRSGSMTGWKITAARRAAARIIDGLTTADRFAVLSFDSTVEWPARLPRSLVEANDRNRFSAVEHLTGLTPRGGTEMLAPLGQALNLLAVDDETQPSAGRPATVARDRILVLVTDGQVGNEDQILRGFQGVVPPGQHGLRGFQGVVPPGQHGLRGFQGVVPPGQHGLRGFQGVVPRVYTIGIDRAVNAGFLGRLAALTGGRCELVESENRLDEVMAQIHRHIAAPLITDIEIAADDAAEFTIELDQVVPRRPPDLFAGAPVTVAGRWRGRPTGALIVSGTCLDGRRWVRPVSAVAVAHPAAAAIWARGHVRELEDRLASRPAQHGAAAAVADLERRIVEVSLRHGVLCRYTAFVAVDTRVVNENGRIHKVTQPVELPSGWEMPSAPRGVWGIHAGGASIAMTPGIVPARRGRVRSRAASETTLARSHNSGKLPRPLGATDPNPEPALEDGVPLLSPEPVAQGNAWRRALEVARRDVSRALDRLGAAGGGGAGVPGRAGTDHTLHELLERLADQLDYLISRLTAAGVPAADFAPLTSLLADLRGALKPTKVPLVDLAELRARAGRVLRHFVDGGPGPQPPESAELGRGSGRGSAFWRPAAS
jgi:Ca-activated chloride channel homolog